MAKDNIFSDIKKIAEKYPEKSAVKYGLEFISYAELYKKSAEISSFLKKSGISEYDTCLLIAEDSIEYILTALGIVASDGVFVSAGKNISKKQFNFLLNEIDIKFIILEDKFIKKLHPDSFSEEISFYTGSKKFTLYRIDPVNKKLKNHELNEFKSLNPAFIRFTSGTTSVRKGVVLSHKTIRDRTDAVNKIFKITEKDTVLWLLPMAYHFAVTIMLFLRHGATIDIAIGIPYSNILKNLISDSITFTYATPFHYSEIIKTTDKSIKIPNKVRMMISTAMPLTKKQSESFFATFKRYLNQAYGIIECGLPCINHKPNEKNVLSVGYQIPGAMLSLALQNEKDSFGEIVIKSPGMFDAYYSPWTPLNEATSHGMFFSGDIGKFNNGCLEIIGRKKSVINFLGHKIFPEQIETILTEHPEILDVCVKSEPHDDYGEVIIAEYVPVENSNITSTELLSFASKHLTDHEIPHHFVEVKYLDRTENGKLKRY